VGLHRITRHVLALAMTGLIGLLPAAAGATDGYFLHGVGTKAKGTGGVAIALPQEASSIATNPATAVELGHRLDVGLDVFIPDRNASISGNATGLDGQYSGNGANPFLMPDIAYVRPLSESVSIGLAVIAHGGMNTSYKVNPWSAVGGTGQAGLDLKQVFVQPTLAVRVADGHSLGISPIGMLQGFRARGLQALAMMSMRPDSITNRGADWSAGAGVKVGYYGKISDRIAVGAFYESKIWASKFGKYAGLFANAGAFNVPSSFGAGLAISPNDRLTIGADFKHIEYSGVPAVSNPIAYLGGGIPFGAADGPGFGWEDIDVYKLGAVFKASSKLTVRAGYSRGQNPVPSSETLCNIHGPWRRAGSLHGGRYPQIYRKVRNECLCDAGKPPPRHRARFDTDRARRRRRDDLAGRDIGRDFIWCDFLGASGLLSVGVDSSEGMGTNNAQRASRLG